MLQEETCRCSLFSKTLCVLLGLPKLWAMLESCSQGMQEAGPNPALLQQQMDTGSMIWWGLWVMGDPLTRCSSSPGLGAEQPVCWDSLHSTASPIHTAVSRDVGMGGEGMGCEH